MSQNSGGYNKLEMCSPEVDYELAPVVPGIQIKAATLRFLVNEMINCFGMYDLFYSFLLKTEFVPA